MEKTLGEQRVRTEFNPSSDDVVSKLKQAAAAYIDLVDGIAVPEVEDGSNGHPRNYLRHRSTRRSYMYLP